MALRQSMSLRLDQQLALPGFRPTAGLTALELELVLDKALEEVQKGAQGESTEPASDAPARVASEKGNYFNTKSFRDMCQSLKGHFPTKRYLDRPEIILSPEGGKSSARYNEYFNDILREKLKLFKAPPGEVRAVEAIFTKRFEGERRWNIAQQLRIAEYVGEVQAAYIASKDPKDLKPLTQLEVARHLKVDDSTVSRLITNLSIQLPGGETIFMSELIPGASAAQKIGINALEQLQKDPALYAEGQWKVSDSVLADILKERFDLDIARRTVSKYKSLMKPSVPES